MMLRAASIADTHAVAAVLAGLARPGDIIVLAGEMGAGKTAFAQGFGRALGITEAITSPTFTLVHSYPCPGGRLTLHHADLYRLNSTGDVEELALHELAEFGGIVLIEWGDVAGAVLGDHLEVRLSPGDDDLDTRTSRGDGDGDDGAGDGDGDAGEDDAGEDGVGDDDVGDDDVGEDDVGEDEDFGLDRARSIELHATGTSWAGRWDRVAADLTAFAS